MSPPESARAFLTRLRDARGDRLPTVHPTKDDIVSALTALDADPTEGISTIERLILGWRIGFWVGGFCATVYWAQDARAEARQRAASAPPSLSDGTASP